MQKTDEYFQSFYEQNEQILSICNKLSSELQKSTQMSNYQT